MAGAKQHNDDFNNSLKELLFGGTIVDDIFWHPLSPAKYHTPPETKKLYTDISENHKILLKIPERMSKINYAGLATQPYNGNSIVSKNYSKHMASF